MLQIVGSFNYLGILFNSNGNFSKSKKNLSDQSSKALFSLLSRCNFLNMPLDLLCELFDRMVVPVLHSSEAWGSGNIEITELVHLKFCKCILKLKKTTATCMVYGEVGRYPMDIQIKSRMIGYCGCYEFKTSSRNKDEMKCSSCQNNNRPGQGHNRN